MKTSAVVVLALLILGSSANATVAACYADPKRLADIMAVVVASYKCPGFDRALFGKPRDTFVSRAEVIDQTTGACERERTLAMNAATERMLAAREAFCKDVETALASDALLAQALIEAGARKAP